MSRTHRNAMMSLIAALALSAPVLASTQVDRLLAQLGDARTNLNAHRENVQTLAAEIASINKTIDVLRQAYAESGDEQLKAELNWAIHDLERHQIRLADEEAAVMEWSRVVEKLMSEIARLDAQDAPGKDTKAVTKSGAKK